MKLVHVTSRELKPGECPPLESRIWNDQWKDAVETELEARRPTDRPSRATSYYAFERIEHAIAYTDADALLRSGPRYFYQVEMDEPYRAPFALSSLADPDHPKLEEICRELAANAEVVLR